MARLKKGLLHGFTGAIGSIEGYELKGQYILRSRRSPSNKPPTIKQLASRQKMRLVSNLLKCFAEFVNLGFAGVAEGQTFTAYNAAVAYQLMHLVPTPCSCLHLAIGTHKNYNTDPHIKIPTSLYFPG